MNYAEINEKLHDITNEDYIWIIYIGIIFLSWYANGIERKYFISNNQQYREKYREVMIVIFSILTIVYLYFLKGSIDDLHTLKPTDDINKRRLTELAAIGSLLIVISGIIFLYIAYSDTNIDVEIAFN